MRTTFGWSVPSSAQAEAKPCSKVHMVDIKVFQKMIDIKRQLISKYQEMFYNEINWKMVDFKMNRYMIDWSVDGDKPISTNVCLIPK